MRSILRHALTCAALLVPGGAMAEGSILIRPVSCVPVMTIQKHGCKVETQLRCGTGDAAFWRSERFDSGEGFSSVSHWDQHYGMMEEQSETGNIHIVYDPTTSFSDSPLDVIAKGTGALAQIGTMSMRGIEKPYSLIAQLKLGPNEVQISGRSLHRFSATIATQYPPPMPVINGIASIYFDEPTGVLFDGEREMEWPPSDGKIPATPAAIILPGEPGFDEPHPTYDCGNLSYNDLDIKADQA